MSVFRMGQCDCCGEERDVGVACSPLGPVSFAYCRDCLKAGAEPYGMLVGVAAGAGVDEYGPWFEALLARNLAHYGKTRAEFDADVLEAA